MASKHLRLPPSPSVALAVFVSCVYCRLHTCSSFCLRMQLRWQRLSPVVTLASQQKKKTLAAPVRDGHNSGGDRRQSQDVAICVTGCRSGGRSLHIVSSICITFAAGCSTLDSHRSQHGALSVPARHPGLQQKALLAPERRTSGSSFPMHRFQHRKHRFQHRSLLVAAQLASV